MIPRLDDYAPIVGPEVIGQLRQLAVRLKGARIVHVNSTREGGGVAEILHRLVPLQRDLGLDVGWEVIGGPPTFYSCTKAMHNALQGDTVSLPDAFLRTYEETNREAAERLRAALEPADFVFIHDPQPAAIIRHLGRRHGKWIWRCHIDVSRPHRPVWKYLRASVERYDASIWHLAEFAQPMAHTQFLIPPSIDPLSEKNIGLPDDELAATRERFGLDPSRPLVLQVSRFDRFKDPVGVVRAYRLVKRFVPVQLVLAGGEAADDPEGSQVLEQVRAEVNGDPDVHVLLLPPDAHRTINALQRIADIVVQKSTKEGFGLTVTEALWKAKPVIGGDVGGIRLQVINHHTGFLVSTAEGAAHRLRYLLRHRPLLQTMGQKAQQFVLENFLLTRHLREYLTLMICVRHGLAERIEL